MVICGYWKINCQKIQFDDFTGKATSIQRNLPDGLQTLEPRWNLCHRKKNTSHNERANTRPKTTSPHELHQKHYKYLVYLYIYIYTYMITVFAFVNWRLITAKQGIGNSAEHGPLSPPTTAPGTTATFCLSSFWRIDSRWILKLGWIRNTYLKISKKSSIKFIYYQ